MKYEDKIFNWMLRGQTQANKIIKDYDQKLFIEAVEEDYRDIARFCFSYMTKYKTPPDAKVVYAEVKPDISFLKKITSCECSEGEIDFFISKLKERHKKSLYKQMISVINEDGELNYISEKIKKIQSKIDRIDLNDSFSKGTSAESGDERYLEYEYIEQNPSKIAGIFTGYSVLDEFTYGLKASEMMVISGATSSGKSLLMQNIGVNAWMGSNTFDNWLQTGQYNNSGKNILYITLEMTRKQTERRCDSKLAHLKLNSITRGRLTLEEKARYKKCIEFQKEYKNKFYILDMPRGTRTIQIEAEYEKILSEMDPDLVCIDYLGIMKSNKEYGSDWLEQGHIAEDLHEFTKKINKPVITAAQRKARIRGAGKKQETIEDSEELGRSKMIGDNANIVLLIENRQNEELLEDMVTNLTKNRDGAKGKIVLEKDFSYMTIKDKPVEFVSDLENEV